MADEGMIGVEVRVKGNDGRFTGALGTIRAENNDRDPLGREQDPVYGVDGVREGTLTWFLPKDLMRRKGS